MTDIKKGDFVTFNDTSSNRVAYSEFTIGKRYPVEEVKHHFLYVKDENGRSRGSYPTRWTKVDPFVVGDYVKITKVDMVDVKKGIKVGTVARVNSVYNSTRTDFQKSYLTVDITGDRNGDVFYFDQIELVDKPTVAEAVVAIGYPKVQVGDWVSLNFNMLQPNNSRFQHGKKYQVRTVTPSGKTIYVEGVQGSTSAHRFVKVDAPKAQRSGILGRTADIIVMDDVSSAPTRKTPLAVTIPTSVVTEALQSTLLTSYGITGVIAGITATPAGYQVVFK